MVSVPLIVNVKDVQNSPPVFKGSTTGIISEDADIGTLVMTIKAEDADYGDPRTVMYEITSSKYFLSSLFPNKIIYILNPLQIL